VQDEPLAERYHDHPLTGDWKDHRDCHIKPDLILIYRQPDAEVLQLVRLGSHAELGLRRRGGRMLDWPPRAVDGSASRPKKSGLKAALFSDPA
jgi:hypothetical protein